MLRRPALVLIVVVGAVGAWWGWRSATETGRRFSELLEVVRENAGKSGPGWSERDGERLWGGLAWFQARDPRELTRRLVAAIREGPERTEAARLIAGVFEYRRFRPMPGQLVENRILPPPPTLAGKAFYEPEPFGFPELVLDDASAVHRLLEQPASSTRRLLLYLLGERPSAPPHAVAALARLAERDTDLDARVEAIRVMSDHFFRADAAGAVLSRLTEDPEPVIRLAALGALTESGDPQRARELLFAVMKEGDPEVRRRGVAGVIRVPESLAARSSLALELMAYLLEGPAGITPEGWELAERFGDVLERRAIGEYDEPVDE